VESFKVRLTKLKLDVAILTVLVTTIWISSLLVNTIYAMPDHSTRNATTQLPTEDNSTSDTPSVLHLVTVPLNNDTNSENNSLFPPSTPGSSSIKPASNAANYDTSSNSGTHHIHRGIIATSSSDNHHKDKNNSHDLGQKITKEVRQKLKVGDIPFP
jgi:hypothetical protein